jgi:hypothetical protein
MAYINDDIHKLNAKVVFRFFEHNLFWYINALLKPLSIKTLEILINTINIPNTPYSAGVTSRAITIPNTNCMNRLENLSTAVHVNDFVKLPPELLILLRYNLLDTHNYSSVNIQLTEV